MSAIHKAVIPVAGLGTRFLPATKALPKELLPLVDKPVLQHIVEEAILSDIHEIIFITSENKTAIERYFDKDAQLEQLLQEKGKFKELESIQWLSDMAQFTFVRQAEPLGLGHAVLLAKDIIGDEAFMVFGGDDIVESDVPAAKQMIDVYAEYGGPVIGVIDVPVDSVDRYGIIDPIETLPNDVYRLRDIIEKPLPAETPSTFGVGGRWLLTPDIFTVLEHTAPGSGSEIQLTDAIRTLVKQRDVYAKKYSGIYRDCGNKLEYTKAIIAFALKHPEIGADIKHYIKEISV